MTRPAFTVEDGIWSLTGPEGLLEWFPGLRQPQSTFHHASPRYPDEQPFDCAVLRAGLCYGDGGPLVGYYLWAYSTNQPSIVEQAMRAQWANGIARRDEVA